VKLNCPSKKKEEERGGVQGGVMLERFSWKETLCSFGRRGGKGGKLRILDNSELQRGKKKKEECVGRSLLSAYLYKKGSG